MQMYYLPPLLRLVQHNSSSIQESVPIVEMKGHNRHLPEDLYSYSFRLDVHVWGCGFAAANLLEDGLERLLKFSTPVCALGHCTRIERGGIIIKRQSKTLPIKVIKCPNKPGERIFDLRFHRRGLGLSED